MRDGQRVRCDHPRRRARRSPAALGAARRRPGQLPEGGGGADNTFVTFSTLAALVRALGALEQEGDSDDEDVDLMDIPGADDAEKEARKQRVRIHFGTQELIALGDIFDFDVEETESPWGGTLWMFNTVAERAVEAQMASYDGDILEPADDPVAGSHNAPMEID
ncbi:hypothetical protein HDZ31DRAFT_63863 [Schizophyllum fasciatum]